MIQYMSMGVLLGLSAGFAPGPLSTLVISETLSHDIRAGIRVSLAPLITDLPIILFSVYVMSQLAAFDTALGIISFLGGGVVVMMGIKSMQVRPADIEVGNSESRSLLKGVLVNFLSPHPYLFWLSVGGPLVLKACDDSQVSGAILYLLGFYIMLVGSKIVLALLVSRFKVLLQGRCYLYVMRTLGVLLCLMALVLFKEGLVFLKIL